MSKGLLAAAVLLAAPAPASDLSGETHAGVFILGFETSAFHPCTLEEIWWLEAPGEINAAFHERAEELREAFEQKYDMELKGWDAPYYYLEAAGDVSEKGEYGHLGAYDRHFTVKSYGAFRLTTPEEQKRCMTPEKFLE